MTEDEQEGSVTAALLLAHGLMQKLVEKGILTPDERDQVFDVALASLEDTPHGTDPATSVARRILDGWAQVAATGKLPGTRPSPDEGATD